MKAASFFGYMCPKCGSSVDIAAIAGTDRLLCDNCKTEMVPNPKGKSSSANVSCKKCNTFYGLVNSDKCPACGEPFS
jgi:rRNA maturation protein Nop10